jgi:hypothetical protein
MSDGPQITRGISTYSFSLIGADGKYREARVMKALFHRTTPKRRPLVTQLNASYSVTYALYPGTQ